MGSHATLPFMAPSRKMRQSAVRPPLRMTVHAYSNRVETVENNLSIPFEATPDDVFNAADAQSDIESYLNEGRACHTTPALYD
jgi:hypothetical protein